MTSDKGSVWQDMKRASQTTILIALLAILGTGPETVWAGINVWTSLGPEGGSIRALAIDPQNPTTLYAGASGGVFKSTNGGESWSAVNSGLTALNISALAIDPQNPSTIYANAEGTLFKSTNRGASWTPLKSGLLRNYDVGPLVIDPQNPSTLYGVGWWFGVFKSTDGGTSWSAVNSGLPSWGPIGSYVYALVIDPQNPSIVHAATWLGVFKSTDAGASWSRPANSGLTWPVHSLAIDPQSTSTLYAATCGGADECNGGGRGELFKSTDSGASWVRLGSPEHRFIFTPLVIDPQNPSTLYVATYPNGVVKSTDGGASWSAVNAGLTPLSVNTLAIDPQNPSTVYAGTAGGGVFAITFVDTPVLTLDSTSYCIGASWSLKVSNAAPNAPIRLLGTSNGEFWEIAQWHKTDTDGSFSVEGTFAEGTEGNYMLRVEIGGVFSNAVSFVVSNCKP